MFDRGENRSFFTVCTLVLTVLGVFGLYALSLTEVPMGTYMGTVVLFLLLMLCTAAGVVFDCRIVAWLFPLVVAGTYLIFNISLNWLAGFRAFDDFPLKPDISWYGYGIWQFLISLFFVGMGYFLLFRAGKLRFDF